MQISWLLSMNTKSIGCITVHGTSETRDLITLRHYGQSTEGVTANKFTDCYCDSCSRWTQQIFRTFTSHISGKKATGVVLQELLILCVLNASILIQLMKFTVCPREMDGLIRERLCSLIVAHLFSTTAVPFSYCNKVCWNTLVWQTRLKHSLH